MNSASTRQHYLKSMGISQWVRREVVNEEPLEEPLTEMVNPEAEHGPLPAPVDETSLPLSALSSANWQSLQQHVSQCTLCDLHKTRTQTVFGIGNTDANWMIIGEAPGADEDRQGEPFVGRAGKLLNAMLQAIGLARADVYIGNILKCRPPSNRDPRPEEVVHCEKYLHRQVALIQPKIILTVGRIAAHNLLKTQESLGKLRGRQFEYGESKIPVIVTYHPAYLLRSPNEKRKAWQDLLLAKKIVERQ